MSLSNIIKQVQKVLASRKNIGGPLHILFTPLTKKQKKRVKRYKEEGHRVLLIKIREKDTETKDLPPTGTQDVPRPT